MSDRVNRRRLSQAIRQLAAGSITNDEFDDLYFDHCAESEDRGVRAIGNAGYFLYGDNRLYRLRGAEADSAQTKRECARAALFMQTDLEYEWPDPPREIVRNLIDALRYGGILLAIAFLFCWAMIVAAKTKDIEFLHPLAVVAVVYLATAVLFRGSVRRSSARQAWEESGEVDVWPFLRRIDLDEARKVPRLLNGKDRSQTRAT
ncbi:MAG: hypothetical protein KF847_11235 [Pirellulales bacterium]|nr:hypothetical protein [Pirellulales bacterium]